MDRWREGRGTRRLSFAPRREAPFFPPFFRHFFPLHLWPGPLTGAGGRQKRSGSGRFIFIAPKQIVSQAVIRNTFRHSGAGRLVCHGNPHGIVDLLGWGHARAGEQSRLNFPLLLGPSSSFHPRERGGVMGDFSSSVSLSGPVRPSQFHLGDAR